MGCLLRFDFEELSEGRPSLARQAALDLLDPLFELTQAATELEALGPEVLAGGSFTLRLSIQPPNSHLELGDVHLEGRTRPP